MGCSKQCYLRWTERSMCSKPWVYCKIEKACLLRHGLSLCVFSWKYYKKHQKRKLQKSVCSRQNVSQVCTLSTHWTFSRSEKKQCFVKSHNSLCLWALHALFGLNSVLKTKQKSTRNMHGLDDLTLREIDVFWRKVILHWQGGNLKHFWTKITFIKKEWFL